MFVSDRRWSQLGWPARGPWIQLCRAMFDQVGLRFQSIGKGATLDQAECGTTEHGKHHSCSTYLWMRPVSVAPVSICKLTLAAEAGWIHRRNIAESVGIEGFSESWGTAADDASAPVAS